MDIQKAIKILNKYDYSTKLELNDDIRNHICDSITVEDFFKTKGIAIEALEKQLPKKPIKHTRLPNKEFNYLCPTCNRVYWNKGFLGNYCDSCGQKITWQ